VALFLAKFGSGVHHFAFAVADMDEAILRATAAGNMADTPIIGNEGVRQIFLRRNLVTGIRIELIERRGGSFT
jgi:4-hydroxyphenylpyruvate dioxygenase-like putative hemolysin